VLYIGATGGGTLATAGGLVFQGTDTGKLIAYGAERGENLWEMNVGAGIMAAPSTYAIDGTQYVPVLAGMGGASALYRGKPVEAAQGHRPRLHLRARAP
jgi:quinohemoprotein ethanol dehydrogenase